jgi:poly(3-hydroxybutyrate) depolymerase
MMPGETKRRRHEPPPAGHLLRWAAAALLASAATADAEPLPQGKGSFVLKNDGEPIEVFFYKPAAYSGGPLVIVVHGSDRNAQEYRDYAIPIAQRFNVLVVAPLFDAVRFTDDRYKYGGGILKDGHARPREQWTFNVIHRLAAEVRRRESAPELPFHVIGHSGGAQFAARMAMYLPGDARGFVAANAGSYTFPTRDLEFPYGLGGLPPELSNDETIRRYLAAPLTLFLGTGDVLQREEDGFDFRPGAMAQGPFRLARGRNFFATMRDLAAERGWDFNWRLVETPDIAHSGSQMFAAPEIGEAIFGKPADAGVDQP